MQLDSWFFHNSFFLNLCKDASTARLLASRNTKVYRQIGLKENKLKTKPGSSKCTPLLDLFMFYTSNFTLYKIYFCNKTGSVKAKIRGNSKIFHLICNMFYSK